MVHRPDPPERDQDQDNSAAWYKYVLWMATPRDERQPGSQTELADEIGVSRRTLARWKREPGFQDAVYLEVRKHLEYRLPEILRALAERAEAGDVPAMRLALELTGRYTEKTAIVHEMREFGADEFKAAADWLTKYEEQLCGKTEGEEPGPETFGDREGPGEAAL